MQSISTGAYNTCAIDTDQKAECWGQTRNGRTVVPGNGVIRWLVSHHELGFCTHLLSHFIYACLLLGHQYQSLLKQLYLCNRHHEAGLVLGRCPGRSTQLLYREQPGCARQQRIIGAADGYILVLRG